MAKKGLAYIKRLTTALQDRTQDIVNAYGQIKDVLTTLKKDVRTDIDNKHNKWYDAALTPARKAGTENQR